MSQPARSARMAAIAFPTTIRFVKTKGARPEIWAYGLRNPHRLSWGPDPANPRGGKLMANSVGYRTWETVNVIERGSNHGWPYREGNQVLSPDQRSHGPLPEVDKIPTQIGDEITDEVVTPKYPVIQYASRSGRRRCDRVRIRLQRQADSRRCAANTSSATSRPAASGTPITKRCWPPTPMATPARWRNITT